MLFSCNFCNARNTVFTWATCFLVAWLGQQDEQRYHTPLQTDLLFVPFSLYTFSNVQLFSLANPIIPLARFSHLPSLLLLHLIPPDQQRALQLQSQLEQYTPQLKYLIFLHQLNSESTSEAEDISLA